jgi:glucose-1-phosphate thymidylyltransferase
MKGIILSAGEATRLYPATIPTSKQLLPVYDKPMIYYPLSVLMLAGIRDILIISKKEDEPRFKELFGTGKQLGLRFSYEIQKKPKGTAEAFIIGEKFIGKDNSCLIFGDNIFYGHGLTELLKEAVSKKKGATVFGYQVKDPERYGVVEFDENNKILSIEEKPPKPKSRYIITGLYFYDNKVIEIAKSLSPSDRGELEITDINKKYFELGELEVKLMGRGFAWLDTGMPDVLLDAGNYVRIIEEIQATKIACIEEIAYNQGFIDDKKLRELAEPLKKSGYGKYLLKLINK